MELGHIDSKIYGAPKHSRKTLNIINILNNLQSVIKQVYQKHRTQNINKKNGQSNYFRAELSQKEEQLLRLKVKKKIDFK